MKLREKLSNFEKKKIYVLLVCAAKLFVGSVYTLGKSNAFFRRSAFHRICLFLRLSLNWDFIPDNFTFENNWGYTLGKNLLKFRFFAQCVKNESKATIDTPDYAPGG